MSWAVEGPTVETPSGKIITMEYPIASWVQIGDAIVVVLDVPPKRVLTENVLALDSDGAIRWQIQRTADTASSPHNCYVGISGHDGNTVTLANWNGMLVQVSVKDGTIIRTWFGK